MVNSGGVGRREDAEKMEDEKMPRRRRTTMPRTWKTDDDGGVGDDGDGELKRRFSKGF